MKRTASVGLASFITVLLHCAVVLADDPQALFEELFGQEARAIVTSPGTTDDAELAKRVLQFAKMATGRRELQVFLCGKAHELGTRCKEGYPVALGAMDLLSIVLPGKLGEAREKKLVIRELQYRHARGGERALAREVLLSALLDEADRRMGEYNATGALTLYRRALSVASMVRSSRKNEILERIKDATEQVKIQKEMDSLARRVKAGSATQAMRKRLLLLYLVERDDAVEATMLLNGISEDERLSACVPRAADPPDRITSAAYMELAEWYVSLASSASRWSRPRMLRRAKHYYGQALKLRSQAGERDNAVAAEVRRAVIQIEKELKPFEAKRGRWIDLLPMALLNPEEHQSTRRWIREGGKLASTGRHSGMIAIPVRPAGSYELECRFTRTEGADSIHVGFLVNGHRCMITLSGWWGKAGGIGKISGPRAATSNVLVAPGHLVNNREHKLHIIVSVENEHSAILRADLNGKPYVSWQGNPSLLSVPESRTVPRLGAIWLDVENNRTVFRPIRLRMLDGKAEILDVSAVGSSSGKAAR